jgi:putative membrane protein
MIVGLADGVRRSVIPAVAGAYGFRSEFPAVGAGLLFVALLLGFGALAAFLRWWRTTYLVGADDIRLEQGVISRSARSVPFERIQDVSLEQKLLARVLGLVEVRFETGAGGKDEIKLAYLSAAEAARLREVVRERRDEAAPAATGEADAAEAGTTLFAMGPKRLALFGLFEFSLAAVAVLAGAAQQFDFLLPFDVWDYRAWEARLAGSNAWFAALGAAGRAVEVGFVVVALLAVGVATGIARTFARDWGFRLDRTTKGFRRRRGLFTRTDTVMPAHRVQALQVRTRLLRRRFGWHSLKFVSLAQDAGSASHVVAPFAQMDEIAPIAAAAGFALPDCAEWLRPSRRAYVDRALLGAALPGLAAVGLLFSNAAPLAIFPLFAAGFLAVRRYFLWRHDRNALDPHQLYQHHGWLAPRLDVASRVKLQSVEIRQGPLGRRRGYADLHLGLAGGRLHFDGLPLARAQQLRAAVLRSIAGTDFSRIS